MCENINKLNLLLKNLIEFFSPSLFITVMHLDEYE